MRATVWFRVSAVVLALLAVGHTIGFLGFRGSSAESEAVRAQMDAVMFALSPGGAATASFGKFYVGFGLFITASNAFTAWLAWWAGSMAKRGSAEVAALGWALVVLMVVSLVLAVMYFPAPPVVLSTVAVVTLAMGTLAARRTQRGDS